MYREQHSNESSPSSIECRNPATGEVLGEVAVDSPAAVRRAIERARTAQAAWGRASHAQRRKVLRRILDHVVRHADELCEMVVRDAGKSREHAMLGEIWPVCEKLRHTIANAERYLAPEPVSSGLLVHKRARIEYDPLGVIGVICAWNYPLQHVVGQVVAPLAAGNAVVVKVSEWVAWSSTRIQAIFDDAFEGTGYSPDLVQLVNGYAETGAAVVSGGVDKVIFIGSMENGRRVIEESAQSLTPVVLELGGKDVLVVCDDAAVEKAAHAALLGAFINAGQNCLAAERILVQDAVYDVFLGHVVDHVTAFRQGPSGYAGAAEVVDLGAMTSPYQVDIVERLVNEAIEAGARALVGGKRSDRHDGQFFEPTVLVDVTPDMAIMREETFGPVMVVCRIADDDEAVAIANDSEYGLGATVFSGNLRRARRLQQRLVTGNVCINDFGMTYMAPDLPFGGVKGSGFGRLNGRDGLRACCNIKAVLDDRVPMSRPTKLFPTGKWDYDVARSTIKTMYGPGVRARVSGLVDLARYSLRQLRGD